MACVAARQAAAAFGTAVRSRSLLHCAATGSRWASSSAKKERLKAFPVFKSSRGVLESNEMFMHNVKLGALPRAEASQRLALNETTEAANAAKAAAQFLTYPSETPILFGSLNASLRPRSLELPGGGWAVVSEAKNPVGSVV